MGEPASASVDLTTHAHLRGAFAPVHPELDVLDLPVRGAVPRGLEGTYIRNGPNPQFEPLGGYTYPFDGDGMLHAVSFDSGRVRYRNRWVLTKGLLAERRAGRALYGGLLAPVTPNPALIGPDGDPGPFKNVANGNVVRHAGRLLALCDGGRPYEVTPALATVGEYDFKGALTSSMAAHPKIDPVWDELCFLTNDVVPPYLALGTVNTKGKVDRIEPIDLPEALFVHDFVVTDQHLVFFDTPAVLDMDAIVRGRPALQWRESRGTRVAVMPRNGTSDDIVWIPVETCFAMHFMNGYTEPGGETVVVDYVFRRRLDLSCSGASSKETVPRLHRAVIDLPHASVRDELVDDRPMELPRVDERRTGLRHRFGYAPTITGEEGGTRGGDFDTLVRYDLAVGTTAEYRLPERITVGEAVFVPRPGGTDEDDGWLLAYTYDAANDASELLVLDAADLAAGPVAAVVLPQRVPAGLHGTWLPAA